ncbi:hypothetical protein AUK57_02260 [Candidatus Saccharibacteria bacterium CG2_30_41_52]|nr:MAG: hypothetical protein AUK57_02260 [Candidatus Saccharibacteria bacterium CG2_30_41_52]
MFVMVQLPTVKQTGQLHEVVMFRRAIFAGHLLEPAMCWKTVMVVEAVQPTFFFQVNNPVVLVSIVAEVVQIVLTLPQEQILIITVQPHTMPVQETIG